MELVNLVLNTVVYFLHICIWILNDLLFKEFLYIRSYRGFSLIGIVLTLTIGSNIKNEKNHEIWQRRTILQTACAPQNNVYRYTVTLILTYSVAITFLRLRRICSTPQLPTQVALPCTKGDKKLIFGCVPTRFCFWSAGIIYVAHLYHNILFLSYLSVFNNFTNLCIICLFIYFYNKSWTVFFYVHKSWFYSIVT